MVKYTSHKGWSGCVWQTLMKCPYESQAAGQVPGDLGTGPTAQPPARAKVTSEGKLPQHVSLRQREGNKYFFFLPPLPKYLYQ